LQALFQSTVRILNYLTYLNLSNPILHVFNFEVLLLYVIKYCVVVVVAIFQALSLFRSPYPTVLVGYVFLLLNHHVAMSIIMVSRWSNANPI